jgi:hypothetical protein
MHPLLFSLSSLSFSQFYLSRFDEPPPPAVTMTGSRTVSVHMISNPCIEVQTFPEDRPSVPAWFAEVDLPVADWTKSNVERCCQSDNSYERNAPGNLRNDNLLRVCASQKGPAHRIQAEASVLDNLGQKSYKQTDPVSHSVLGRCFHW